MKRFRYVLTLVICLGFTGCQKSTEPTATTPATGVEEHAHVHGNDTHDHSQPGHSHDHSQPGHSHGIGPHGGTVVDWGGGKYHVELTVDHEKQHAMVFVYGSDETTPSPIDAASIELVITSPEILVTLQAAPQVSDPAGRSSRFVGTHEKLGVVQEFAGTMIGVVDGTPYSGDFQE